MFGTPLSIPECTWTYGPPTKSISTSMTFTVHPTPNQRPFENGYGLTTGSEQVLWPRGLYTEDYTRVYTKKVKFMTSNLTPESGVGGKEESLVGKRTDLESKKVTVVRRNPTLYGLDTVHVTLLICCAPTSSGDRVISGTLYCWLRPH